MEACVCKYCGKLFMSHSKTTSCRECIHLDNERFHVIENYLMNHPGANALQLASGLNIKVSEIVEYINEGRLVVMNNQVKIPDSK